MAGSAVVGVLRVLLTADAAEFEHGLKKGTQAIKGLQKDLGQMGQRATALGGVLTSAVTLPVIGLGAAAIKMATDFESSFAGVRKTVDATEPEFAQLSQGLRDMAKEIPINVNELNRVAEAAGQLGIKKEDILQFTKTMADLGVTTNLTADQAATATAQIQNIFGAAGKDVDRFGATLVALGNAGASTEADIIAMGLRIAGAGNQVGLTQPQVLAFASALSSVGIEAEAGGTAISRAFLTINDAVMSGGPALDEFARVAGMSAAQFKQSFEQDAARAMVAFINGLSRIKGEGENVNQTLKGLELGEIRVRDALMRATGAGSLLTEQLALGNRAWQENTALTEEAEKRYATFESQLKLFWAQVRDVGVDLGTALVPVLRDLLTSLQPVIALVADGAAWFAKLPEPVRLAAVAVGAVVAAIGPVLVGFGMMATAISTALPLIAGIGGALAALATGPVLAIGAAVVGLAAIWMTWGDDITRVVSETVGAVKQWLVNIWQSDIVQSVAGLVQSMAQMYIAAFDLVSAAAGALIGTIRDWLVTKFQPVVDAVQPVLSILQNAWTVAKDAIVGTASAIYTGVKSWLVDRFTGIVDGIKAKIDAVTGFFRDMQDKVVGNSYVPDMVSMIGEEFGKLETLMVNPAETVTTVVSGLFSRLTSQATGHMQSFIGGVGEKFGNFLGGGGGGFFGNLVSQGMSSIFGPGGIVMNLATQGLTALADIAWKGLQKIGGFFKDMFGGPSAKELGGRQVAEEFRRTLDTMLTDQQRLETGDEQWKNRIVVLRDKYIDLGLTEQEALDDLDRLWRAEKLGAEAASRVISEIDAKLRGLPTERRVNIEARYTATGDVPEGGGDEGFAGGTIARLGKWFGNFPTSGFATALHGPEAVITPAQAPAFAMDVMAGMASQALTAPRTSVRTERDSSPPRSDLAVAHRLESLINRLEHVLPITIRDAVQLASA